MSADHDHLKCETNESSEQIKVAQKCMKELDHKTDELITNQQSHQDCLDKLQNFYVNKFNATEDLHQFQALMENCLRKNGVPEKDNHDPFQECTGL